MFRSLFLTLIFAFSFFQQAYGQGLNLNPALLNCIMSGWHCLDHTGIPIIDQFLGNGVKTPSYTRDMQCRDFEYEWCGSIRGGEQRSGFVKCREARKAFYKQKAQEKGEWNPPTGQNPKYHAHHLWTEEEYFEQLEDRLTQRGQSPHFTCNYKQREMFMKAICGENYMDWRYLTTETKNCKQY